MAFLDKILGDPNIKVVKALQPIVDEINNLEDRLKVDPGGFKCIFLTDKGCLWKLKPIVCEMFLCDHAKNMLTKADARIMDEWNELGIPYSHLETPNLLLLAV